MTTLHAFYLARAGMGAPVRHSVGLCAIPPAVPCVTCIVVLSDAQGWGVLADHPDNPGVSVTNGAHDYAQVVCRSLGCDSAELAWFEIDSNGDVDRLHMTGRTTGFSPLHEALCPPRSLAALVARLTDLPGGLPEEALAALTRCAQRFESRRRGTGAAGGCGNT